jgi:hypothetical protein
MKRVKFASAALGLITGVLAAAPASAWDRRSVHIQGDVPDLIGQAGGGVKSSVEGITVGLPPDNNIYAASSGVNSGLTSSVTGPANLFVFDPNAQHTTPPRQLEIKAPGEMGARVGSVVNGIRFNPATKALWVLNMLDAQAQPPLPAGAQILAVDTATGNSSFIARPALFPANATLNGLTFDKAGSGYVTDSSNGRIYKIPSGGISAGGTLTTWKHDKSASLAAPIRIAKIAKPTGSKL